MQFHTSFSSIGEAAGGRSMEEDFTMDSNARNLYEWKIAATCHSDSGIIDWSISNFSSHERSFGNRPPWKSIFCFTFSHTDTEGMARNCRLIFRPNPKNSTCQLRFNLACAVVFEFFIFTRVWIIRSIFFSLESFTTLLKLFSRPEHINQLRVSKFLPHSLGATKWLVVSV